MASARVDPADAIVSVWLAIRADRRSCRLSGTFTFHWLQAANPSHLGRFGDLTSSEHLRDIVRSIGIL